MLQFHGISMRNDISDADSCPDNDAMGNMFFQVEGLMDDIDFKAKVTRAEFEELCADLFERVPRPVQDALTAAEMKMVSILITRLYKSYQVQLGYRTGQD